MTNKSTMEGDGQGDKAVKISLPLSAPLHAALKNEAWWLERELTEHIQRILAEHAIEKNLLKPAVAKRLQMMWELVTDAVEVAKTMCREGKFSSSITLNAIQACTRDPAWAAKYREYVQDDIFKSGNPLKGPINRELGFRIKAGIGGKIVQTPQGKPAHVKVLGEIIQGYTPLATFDPAVVDKKNDPV